jgi:hypothetical protein
MAEIVQATTDRGTPERARITKAADIDVSPGDAPRIERVASQDLSEVEPTRASFEGRNRKSLVRMAAQVDAWHVAHATEASRMTARSKALCAKMPSEHERCASLLKVAVAMPTAPTS